MGFYRMKMGDTLESLAIKCDIDIYDLAEANVHIGNVKNEYIGTVIAIPDYRSRANSDKKKKSRYIVNECCHVTQLSDEMKTSLETLLELNPKLKLGKVVPEGEVVVSDNIKLPGNAIIFVSDRENKPKIFCFYNDKRGHIDLNAPSVGMNSVPKVSPDGSRICYIDSDNYLRILEMNKLEGTVITETLFKTVSCKWNLASDKILYENMGQITIHDTISGDTMVIGYGRNPEWIGDGCNVIYLENGTLCRCDIYTGKIDKRLNNPEVKLGIRASCDGSFLSYFTRYGSTYTLKIMDVHSGEYSTAGNFKDVWFSSGCWSNDDKYFAFWHPAQNMESGRMSKLKVINRAGEEFCEIPAVTQRAASKLAWSPDSQYLAFSARSFCGLGQYSIFSVGLNGDFGQVTGIGNCFNPDWM